MNFVLSFDTTKTKGGYDDTFTTKIDTINPKDSSNLFYYPIGPEFLYTKSKNIFKFLDVKPQVRIFSNGNEAACFTETCSFNFVEAINYSKVTTASLTGNTITIKLDKILDSNVISDAKIYLGCNYCVPSSLNTSDLSCTFTYLCVGSYKPYVKTNLGDLINDNAISEIQINMTVDSISPDNVFIIFNFKGKI